jgi:hypothetical protein
LATTVKVAVSPTVTVWLAGCVAMDTAVAPTVGSLELEPPPQAARKIPMGSVTAHNIDRKLFENIHTPVLFDARPAVLVGQREGAGIRGMNRGN